ncbi:MAG: DUF5706 domain-containing protein [Actinomycetota bacterium]|nr:DUF5706 domain-containing protein [Actinomycetota bacterium]
MSDDFDRVGFAWKVHDALDAWTNKVDSKASIILAVETGVLALVATLAKDGPLASLRGPSVIWFRLGILAIVAAIVMAGAAVFPQLRRSKIKAEWNENSIYFGHLRFWDPERLAEKLESQTEGMTLEELARQHVTMASIAWSKHAFLQVSMWMLPLGVVLLWASTR